MIGNQYRQAADGGIDYDHYRGRARRLRQASRRRTRRHCARFIRPFVGVAAIAAAFFLVPASTADCCIVCGSKPLNLVIANHHQ